VFTLRCTKKLLVRLGSMPALDEVEPTTRFGDWYANLLFRPGGQVVLFVNERSLLPVLVPATPSSSLVSRFLEATVDVLRRRGVSAAAIKAERREMGEVRIGEDGEEASPRVDERLCLPDGRLPQPLMDCQ
jgi:hypothetical protein